MKNYITEGGVASLEVVKMLGRCALRGALCNDRKLSSIYSYVQIYGGEKITLLTKVKKGCGKGKPRKVVFFKQRNPLENLTWMEK